jgi:hypothetical protein
MPFWPAFARARCRAMAPGRTSSRAPPHEYDRALRDEVGVFAGDEWTAVFDVGTSKSRLASSASFAALPAEADVHHTRHDRATPAGLDERELEADVRAVQQPRGRRGARPGGDRSRFAP